MRLPCSAALKVVLMPALPQRREWHCRLQLLTGLLLLVAASRMTGRRSII
jgi:hypothetical protein